MRDYYEQRAAEYDATSYEQLLQDPVGARDLDKLEGLIAARTPGRVLDIGCGSGWLTRAIRGDVVAVDQSQSMLRLAAARLPQGVFIHAMAPPLPFADNTFDTALTSHVYGHIESEADRNEFLGETLRVASELIIVEQARPSDHPGSGWEDRPLRDGSRHRIYKRYYTAAALADEVGGRVLLDTASFVVVARKKSAVEQASRQPNLAALESLRSSISSSSRPSGRGRGNCSNRFFPAPSRTSMERPSGLGSPAVRGQSPEQPRSVAGDRPGRRACGRQRGMS